MNTELERTLFSTVEVLEALGIPYAVVGGLAVGAWGVSRSTRDVDLYAELPPRERALLEEALVARGFDVPAMEAELETFGVFRSRSAEGVFVDIFSAVGPLGEAVLARRVEMSVAGRSLWMITSEDLAVLKAFSDRPRDFEDLVKLSAVVGPTFEVQYVEDWARRLDESMGGDEVSDRLRKALVAARKSAPATKRGRRRSS
jgi:predicted nucleotidyltransferase